jgi:protocatechuate 3,4-dioxygenase beta subunit
MKFFFTIAFYLTCCSIVKAQDIGSVVKQIEDRMIREKITVSEILSDEKYMYLHAQSGFRELIKKYAPTGYIKIVTDNEPGRKIKVVCTFKNNDGTPFAGAFVYFYQTSAKGWYSDTAAHILVNEGDHRHARLFGYAVTDSEGKIEISTIQPSGYPNSDLPAHIHISMWKNSKFVRGVPGELLFEDDNRLTAGRKQHALREGYIISKNTGTETSPVYNYHININN